MRAITALIVGLLLVGCTAIEDPKPRPETPIATESSSFDNIRDISSLSITLHRGYCYGVCPAYTVEVRGNGSIEYCGSNFVKEQGFRDSAIDVAEVQGLFDKIIQAGFLEMPDEYVALITDSPTYIINISYDDVSKSLTDYVGSIVGMPEIVTELENEIDSVAGTDRWIGGEEYRRLGAPAFTECPDPSL